MDLAVTPIVEAAVEGIVLNTIFRQIGYLTKLNEKAESLTNKMSELTALKEDIAQKVVVSERQQMEIKNTVQEWRDKVKSVEGKVARIDADFQQSKNCLHACYPDCCSSRYILGKKIVKMIAEVSELIIRGNELINNVADIRLPPPVEMIPSTSVVGADLVINQVLGYLKEEDVRIIALHGMGGVGKTTILEKINNDLVGNQDFNFNIVISVAVNNDVKPREIQKAIYKRLGMPWSEDETVESRKGNLHENLCKLRYLLLLDNMWDYLDLVKVIGVPEPTAQNKCKVVFTTRNEEVCGSMGTHRTIKIEGLGEADAWNLFQEKVGGWILDCPSDVLSLAQEVAKKCGGLPLALVTVGRAMASKKTLPEWRNAERALRTSAREVKGMHDVFSCLKYSYDCLQDDATKSCFLYCSFFPESSDIEIDDVIRYWIGEGYFDGIESYIEAYDKGCDVLGSLKKACLLESGFDENRFVRMHDVVREMALGVALEFGKKGKLISEESGVDEWNEAESVLLIGEGLSVLPESPKCPNLSTLILKHNFYLKNVPETFFQNMHTLRVVNLSCTDIVSLPQSFSLLENVRYLNLSNTAFREVPMEIGRLIKLQHLDLSSTKIREVPMEIGRLIKLQHLDLSSTKIREVPMEIGRLIKLQHLDLSSTKLESLPQALGDLHSLEHLNLQGTKTLQTIPHATISKLSQLKELNFIHGFGNWELKEWGDDNGIGVKLEVLESLKHLRTLGITIENDHIFQGLFQSPFLLKRTKQLEIKNSKELSLKPLLSASFADMGVLHELHITSCKRLEEFIIGSEVKGNFLGSLHILCLRHLPNLNSIWEGTMPHGCLGNLCSLNIYYCHKLKSLRWVHNLPCLEDLSLQDCDEMEEVLGDDEVIMEDIIFLKLKYLTLRHLPKLVRFYHHSLVFPSLESIDVHECPQLKKLPLGAHTARKLRFIYGERKWWEALEWEDEETNKALLPLYQGS